MSIFTRYLGKRFFKPFLFSLGIFILLIFLGSVFDRLNYLINDTKAPLGVILEYLWLDVPYWALRTAPVATLLATLVSLTGFVQSGEWIAFQASGFEPRHLWTPFLGCSLLIALGVFAAQETLLPYCDRSSQRLWHESLYPGRDTSQYTDVTLLGGPDEFIQTKLFIPKAGKMVRPTIERTNPDGSVLEWDAEWALWDAGSRRWILHDGVERSWGDGAMQNRLFKEKVLDLYIPPLDLIPRTTDPDRMSLFELIHFKKSLVHLGLPERTLAVAVYQKFFSPLTNLIICALGIPIALALGRASRFLNFTLSLGVSFLYIWLIEVGRILGQGGGAPAFPAVLFPHLVFAAAAAYLINRYAV